MAQQYTTELLKDKKVLLIENDEVNQMLIGFMIEDQGGHCHIEADAKQVVKCLHENRPDLILLDTGMDGVNALEFTQMMRKEMDISVPIIGMSSKDLRGRGIYHGLDAVIKKPVQYPDLQSLLQEVMD